MRSATDTSRSGVVLALVLACMGLVVVGSVAAVYLQLADDGSPVLVPVQAPPNAERAAEAACSPGRRADSIEVIGSNRLRVTCIVGPLSVPRTQVFVECVDGDWNGPTSYGESGALGVPCVERPVLLTPDDLVGAWRSEPLDRTPIAPICDVDLGNIGGMVRSEEVELFSQEEHGGVVTHRLLEYSGSSTAASLMHAIADLGTSCKIYLRPDPPLGDARVTVESLDLPEHPDAVGLRLLVEWADGTGQGWCLAATRSGPYVHLVSVDAVQGGIPTDESVSEVLTAIRSSSVG